MSKSYIVETDDETQLIVEIGVNSTGAALITTHPVRFLTPYAEPDLNQAMEDAFKNGYDAACKDIDVKSKTNAAYRKGLEDAWNAARKIVLSREDGGLFSYEERKAVFGCGNYMALKKFLAQEAIEKIRQYEQEQEKIKVGDEVEAVAGKAVIIEVLDNGKNVRYMYPDASFGVIDSCNLTRTGRHFPEIAEVLRKMQEEKE